MVVDKSDEGYALNPHPELSTGLLLASGCGFECVSADQNVGFQGGEDGTGDGVGVA